MTPDEIQNFLKSASKSKTIRVNGIILALWGVAKAWGIATYPEIALPVIAVVNLILRGVTTMPLSDK